VAERSNILLIGDGRLARHLGRYFEQLRLPHLLWSRRLELEERCPRLEALVHSDTHALLAISDGAIEPFIRSHPELNKAVRIHFSGRLATPLAIGAHPLFSFAGTFYERELYERIPFVIDQGSAPLASLIPGMPNPSFSSSPNGASAITRFAFWQETSPRFSGASSSSRQRRSLECRANMPFLISNRSRGGFREPVLRFPVPSAAVIKPPFIAISKH
jgi:hypothetical protein